MKPLRFLWNGLLWLERFVLVVSAAAIILLVFATVILRYFFKYSFLGMEEVVMLCAVLLYFIGSGYGSYEEHQISADLSSMFIKNEKTLLALKSARGAAETILMAISVYLAAQLVVRTAGIGKATLTLHIPFALLYSVVLAGLALMTLYSAWHTIRYLRLLTRGLPGGRAASPPEGGEV
ncbi:MAG: TRAP transporter small permease [Gracilibacteraceae bacterium]|jgi:TRAP-type C4-dicarboxylate transport system permease small subunit|nr:TRAP transporter small permease [Gracilibacteraceae bacterium]